MSGPIDQEVLAQARREAANMRPERLRTLLEQGPGGVPPELWSVLVAERKRRVASQNLVPDPVEPTEGENPFGNIDWLIGSILSDKDVAVPEGFIQYRGVRMTVSWPERIREAQEIWTYSSGSRELPRIPYCSERDASGADAEPCYHCHVFKGELHVVGCDAEECPFATTCSSSATAPMMIDESEP